jgi:hypothetical protein
MKRNEPNPASAQEQAEGSRENVNVGADQQGKKHGADDFKPKVDLPGKTDSGPEPDVFGRDIPPQE